MIRQFVFQKGYAPIVNGSLAQPENAFNENFSAVSMVREIIGDGAGKCGCGEFARLDVGL